MFELAQIKFFTPDVKKGGRFRFICMFWQAMGLGAMVCVGRTREWSPPWLEMPCISRVGEIAPPGVGGMRLRGSPGCGGCGCLGLGLGAGGDGGHQSGIRPPVGGRRVEAPNPHDPVCCVRSIVDLGNRSSVDLAKPPPPSLERR